MSNLGTALLRMRQEKAAREGRRVTQREVADALEVPHVYVSRWETGRNVPERYAVAQLARFYGVEEAGLLALREQAVAESDGRRITPTSPSVGGDRRRAPLDALEEFADDLALPQPESESRAHGNGGP